MLDMSISKSGTSSTYGKVAILEDTGMEMREDNNGLCDWVTTNILET